MDTPVIVFGFNRSEHLRRTLEALAANTVARQATVYIFIDKPVEGDDGNIRRNKEVIDMLNNQMDDLKAAFGKVELRIAKKHLGCRDSIVGAIDEIIHKYGRAIMVEDDIVTAPDFMQLMDEMLAFYGRDDRVFSVGGYSEPMECLKSYDKDVYASYRATSWGWGTWADRFDMVDFNLGMDALKDEDAIKRLKRGGADIPGLLKNELLGLSDAWDVQFAYAHAKYDKISILPTISRVYNIGMDNSGTHCTSDTTQADAQQAIPEVALDYKIERVDIDPIIVKEFYQRHSYDFLGKLKRNFNVKGFIKAIKRLGLVVK